MLKVLSFGRFLDDKPGGIQSHVYHLFKSMRGVIDYVNLVPARNWRDASLSLHGFPSERKRGIDLDGSVALSPALISEAWRTSHRQRFDVVHLHFPDPMSHLASMAVPASVPRVITWHADITRQRRAYLFYKPLLSCAARRADAIIAPTARHRDGSPILSELHDKSRIHIVPYGFDFSRFLRPAEGVQAIRARLPGPRIFTLGRHVSYKGLDVLLRAMPHVRNDVRLTIGGEGPLTERLQSLAGELGIADRIDWAGMIPDERLPAYYQACEVFCLPSVTTAEAFGIVQVEAMASGKPVVSTRLNTGVSEVNEDGVTGLTVEPGDPVELADRLNRLLDDRDLALQLGENARKKVVHCFGLDRMRDQTLKVYEEAIACRSRKQ